MAHDDSAFEISQEGHSWIVSGGKVERLARVTDFRNPAATRRLMNIYKAMGVFKALSKAGAREGETVILSGREFEYFPEEA